MGNLMGRRIRELRLEKGLSQEELGRTGGISPRLKHNPALVRIN